MSKKRWIIYLVIFISLLCVLCIAFMMLHNNKISKFYLDDKYYNVGQYIDMNADDLENIKDNNYIIFTYNYFCQFSVPCEDIFKKYMEKYDIDFIYISYDEFKKTSFHKTVKYVPSVIIVRDGKIIDYLNAEDDTDVQLYQDVDAFTNWINGYIYTDKK